MIDRSSGLTRPGPAPRRSDEEIIEVLQRQATLTAAADALGYSRQTLSEIVNGRRRPHIRRKLEAGDYSVDGWDDVVAVERKSLPDFVRMVIHDFPRFAAELDQLARLSHACIVVEADLNHVLSPGRVPLRARPPQHGSSDAELFGCATGLRSRAPDGTFRGGLPDSFSRSEHERPSK